MKNSFLFVGGDLRMLYAAQKLASLYNVYVYGFDDNDELSDENVTDKAVGKTDVHILHEPPAEKYDYIVLPLPASMDGKTVNSPYSSKEIALGQVIPLAKKAVFCGKTCPQITELCTQGELEIHDYFVREELTVRNALITAEGALEILLRESSQTISGSRILLTGYGRISRILLKQLTALGAKVTVAARKCDQLAWAEINGAYPVCLCELAPLLGGFDMIVNTIPAHILDGETLPRIRRDCLIVDLASKPGLDLETARESGLKVIWALSLPGKTAPITAGEIITDSIVNILTEGGTCCDG